MNCAINTLDQLKPILIGFRKSNSFSQKVVAEKLGIKLQLIDDANNNDNSSDSQNQHEKDE